jgi:hypothetical protein
MDHANLDASNKRNLFQQSKNMSSHNVKGNSMAVTGNSEKKKFESNEHHIENFI